MIDEYTFFLVGPVPVGSINQSIKVYWNHNVIHVTIAFPASKCFLVRSTNEFETATCNGENVGLDTTKACTRV